MNSGYQDQANSCNRGTVVKVCDNKLIKNLMEEGVLNYNYIINQMFHRSQRAYNGNENFKFLKKKRIWPIIKVKMNPSFHPRITRYGMKYCNYKQRLSIRSGCQNSKLMHRYINSGKNINYILNLLLI